MWIKLRVHRHQGCYLRVGAQAASVEAEMCIYVIYTRDVYVLVKK